jgi:hypothetical protein
MFQARMFGWKVGQAVGEVARRGKEFVDTFDAAPTS